MAALNRIRICLIASAVLLASCGGGGGSAAGDAKLCKPSARPVAAPAAWLPYSSSDRGGDGTGETGLFVLPSSDTRQAARRVDTRLVQSRAYAYVFQRDAQGRTTTARPTVMYYIAGSGLFRLDLGAGAAPAPVRISPFSLAVDSRCGWKVSQTRLADATSSFALLRLPGGDGSCDTGDDDVHLLRYTNTPGMASTPVVGATEKFTSFYDAAGQLSGLLVKSGDRLVMVAGPEFGAMRTLASAVQEYSVHTYSGRDAMLQVAYEDQQASFQYLDFDGNLSSSLHDFHEGSDISAALSPDGRHFVFMERDGSGYMGPSSSNYVVREKIGHIPADGSAAATILSQRTEAYGGIWTIYIPPRYLVAATQSRIVILSGAFGGGETMRIETLPIDTPASPQTLLSGENLVFRSVAVNGDVVYFDMAEGDSAAARLDVVSGELEAVANARWLGVAGQQPQFLADRAVATRTPGAAAILLAEDLDPTGRLGGARVSALQFSVCQVRPLKQADGSDFRFPAGYDRDEPISATALTGLGSVTQLSSTGPGYQSDVFAFDIGRSRMDLLPRTPSSDELP